MRGEAKEKRGEPRPPFFLRWSSVMTAAIAKMLPSVPRAAIVDTISSIPRRFQCCCSSSSSTCPLLFRRSSCVWACCSPSCSCCCCGRRGSRSWSLPTTPANPARIAVSVTQPSTSSPGEDTSVLISRASRLWEEKQGSRGEEDWE